MFHVVLMPRSKICVKEGDDGSRTRKSQTVYSARLSATTAPSQQQTRRDLLIQPLSPTWLPDLDKKQHHVRFIYDNDRQV